MEGRERVDRTDETDQGKTEVKREERREEEDERGKGAHPQRGKKPVLVSADVTTYRVEEHLASLPPSCIHAAVTQLSRTQCSSPLFSSLPIRAARPFFHLSSPIFSRTQRHSLRALASNFPLFAIIAHHRRIRHRRVFPLFKSNRIRDRCPSLLSSLRLSTGRRRRRVETRSELPVQGPCIVLERAKKDEMGREAGLSVRLATARATSIGRCCGSRLVYAGPVPACNIGQWARAIMATRTCAALRAPATTDRRATSYVPRLLHPTDRSDLHASLPFRSTRVLSIPPIRKGSRALLLPIAISPS